MNIRGEQYFGRYAEPEAELAAAIGGEYAACLVVPAKGEPSTLLDGYEPALRGATGRVLLILVVNAADADTPQTHDANRRLGSELAARFSARDEVGGSTRQACASLARASHYDLLVLDRASAGRRLRTREGVGNARKIGCDLAVRLWANGQVECPYIACTDADVTLPDDYFASLSPRALPSDVTDMHSSPTRAIAALLWPFRHVPADNSDIDRATLLYEVSLRYYVLGLASAGSGYAYQSIGSTVCVDAASYLAVRGFPKRAAAEDFYLLDKLAKVAPLARIHASPVRIAARASDRVPFGTGRRSREIAAHTAAGGEFTMYAPQSFRVLSAVLSGLDAFSESKNLSDIFYELETRVPKFASRARGVLIRSGVVSALEAAATQAPRGPVLRRRVHTYFDALRTLRFVHGLRDAGLPMAPWRAALSAFALPGDAFARGDEPAAVCEALAAVEERLEVLVGPTLPRPALELR